MANLDKSKLMKMTDEVEELHPLLNVLLPKLPNVINVEYTHGTEEMGADFVIARQNEVFGTTDYIGVIAKVGRLAQDFSGIERQIEECDVPRLVFGGKDRIRITEVWVIVTGNITGGAKDKIHEKYKSRKIEFVDGGRLVGMINKYMPIYWTSLSLQVGEYLSKLRAKNEEMDRALSLIPIMDRDFYIEQDIYQFPLSNYRMNSKKERKPIQKVDIYKEIENQDLILIEGSMGSGKSKLIRRLVDRYTTPDVYTEKRFLPIVISYKELAEKFDGDILRLIDTRIDNKLRQESQESTFLLLIDGVDEKNWAIERQVEELTTLIERIRKSPKTKAIITSRYLRGLEESHDFGPGIARYELPALSMNRTIEFLTTVCQQLNLASRLIEDLKRSQLFKELPKSPISAILLAKLLKENHKDLPSNMTELYSQYLELMLGRWDMEKGLQSQKEYQALDTIMMRLAITLLDYEMTSITVPDAKEIVSSYLRDRNLNIDPEILFEKMVKRCEVLVLDPASNTLGFKHRTFAEFFYAKDLVKKGNLSLEERAFHLYWMNTIFFYLGILKDCPGVLNELIELSPTREAERWFKVINMANYMLAAYASPYRVITDGITKTAIETANLFKDIVCSRIDSPFEGFSHMSLLFLMQLLVRDSYSYEFFKNAIEEAALKIDGGQFEEDTKAYALFFLNVAYIDLGGEETFDFLLKSHSTNLPIDLALAIHHESSRVKERTTLMRKQDRRVKHLLKGNAVLKANITKMYEQPIRLLPKKKEDCS